MQIRLNRRVECHAPNSVVHDVVGVYSGPDQPYLVGPLRVNGRDPQHRSYRSFLSDPDGNGWLMQEIPARLPGRVATPTYSSAADLWQALRRAAAAHRHHEARIGQADPNWPDWYAVYMVREQAGEGRPR